MASTAPRNMIIVCIDNGLHGAPGDWTRNWNLANCRLRFGRACLERKDG